MLYLSGSRKPGKPHLATPATSYRLDGIPIWAADNGAFTGKYPGDTAYLAWLESRREHAARCLFVACPDVLGDSRATLAGWARMAPVLKAAGWPVALVLQDGMELADITALEPYPDWLFIGGSTDFKLGESVREIVAGAGIPTHMGRVNSRRRTMYAAAIGCASVDGNVLAFDPHKPVWRWAEEARDQTRLF